MTGSLPRVTVVMPVRNEGDFIRESLGAVLNQDYPKDQIEIILADGMSTDRTRDIIKSYQAESSNIHLIDNPKMIVAPGLNEAIRQSHGSIVVRVDGHCVIAPDYVSQCVRLLQEKKADAVGGPIETIGETSIAKAIAFAMSSWFGVGGSAFRTIRDKEMEVETVPFPAYPKSVFDKIGYFDEGLVRNQDDEFNYRLKESGGKIILSPQIRSTYYSRGSLKSLWNQYFQYGFWKVRVMQKHPRQMRFRQFVPLLFVSAVIFFGIGGFFCESFQVSLSVLLIIYLAACFGVSLGVSLKHGMKHLIYLPLVYGALHFSYGFGFLTGLCHFFGRWGKK